MVNQALVQAEQNIQREERRFSEAKTKAEQLDPRIKQTREQLSKATPTSQQQVRLAERKRQQEKVSQLREIERKRVEFQQAVAPTRASIEDVRAYETAKKHYERGQLAFALGADALQGRVKYWGEKILKQKGLIKQAIFKQAGGYEGYTSAIKAGSFGDVALYQAGQAAKTFKPAEVSMEKYNELLVKASSRGAISEKAKYELQRVTPTLTPKQSPSSDIIKQKVVSEYKKPTTEQKDEQRFYDVRFGKGNGKIAGAVGAVTGKFFSMFASKKPEPIIQKGYGAMVIDKEVTMRGGTDVYRTPTEAELFKQGGESLVVSSKLQTELMKENIRNQALIDDKSAQIHKAISSGGITEQEAKSANLFLEQYAAKLGKESSEKLKANIKTFTKEVATKYKPITAKIEATTLKYMKPSKFDSEKTAKTIYEKYKDDPRISESNLRAKIKTKVYTGAFLSGAYEGIRTQPVKALKTAAIVSGITAATILTGGATGTGALAIAGRTAGYGLLGYYGLATAGRIATTSGTEAKFFKAGEITSTELIPMALAGFGTRALFKKVVPPKQIQVKQSLKVKRLENVKRYGKYSRFAETGYKQYGFGKKLSPEVIKRTAKVLGVGEEKIIQGTLFRQTLKVKSGVGLKTVQTGRWGVSFYEQTGKGIVERGGTFKLFKGKPTKWEFLTTKTKGSYAYTTKQILTPKGFKTIENYLTKNVQVFAKKYGTVKVASYKYTTRLIPKGYSSKELGSLWKKIGSTYDIGKGVSSVGKMPLYRKGIGYDLKVAKEGEYMLYSKGKGKPLLATKGIYSKVDASRFIPKGKGSGLDYSAWKPKSVPKPVSTGSKGVTPKIISKQASDVAFKVTPVINTLSFKTPPKTPAKFISPRTDTSTAVVLGLGVGSMEAIREKLLVKQITKTDSKLKTISATKQATIAIADVKQIQPSLLVSKSATSQKSLVVNVLSPATITKTKTTPTSTSPTRSISSSTSGINIREGGARTTPKKKEEPFSLGYKVEVKRKGVFKTLGGVYSRGEAIKLGERKALATLAATFKVTPTFTKIRKVDKERYVPNPVEFRSYKVVKGQKVELKDTWIQRRGKRLGRKSEVKEIQFSKKSKGRRIKII